MQELIKVDYKEKTVLARDVYDFVYKGQEKKQAFTHWFKRTVNKYGFEEQKDFMPIWTESTGGRPSIDYVVTFDMGKELTMISATEQGKKARQYFLRCEEIVLNNTVSEKAVVLLGKEVRKSLTDAVQDSGEQERMHKHGFSTYTLMVYKFLGIKKDYQDWKKETGGKGDYRKTLSVEMRERIATAEGLEKGMLNLQKQKKKKKKTLEPLFKVKELK